MSNDAEPQISDGFESDEHCESQLVCASAIGWKIFGEWLQALCFVILGTMAFIAIYEQIFVENENVIKN